MGSEPPNGETPRIPEETPPSQPAWSEMTRPASGTGDSPPHPGPGYPPPPYSGYAPYPGYPAQPPFPYVSPEQARPKRGGPPWYAWVIGGCLALVALVVIGCVVLTGVLAGIAIKFANLPTATDTNSQTITVTGTPTLDIQNASGKVTIQQGTNNTQVVVRYTRKARGNSPEEAKQHLSNIQVSVTPNGNTVTVVTTASGNGGIAASFNQVDLEITTPAHTDVRVTNDAGSIAVTGVSGVFNVALDVGDLEMREVTFGDGSQIQVNAGSVDLSGALAQAASLIATVNVGDLRLALPAETAAHLRASTGRGQITITGWPITPTGSGGGAMSASGDLGSNPRGTITLHDDTGHITVEQS